MASEDGVPQLDLAVFSDRIQRLCAEGNTEAALAEVEAALETIEPSARLHGIHANVLRLIGDYGLAAVAFVEAAKLEPKDSAAWFGMAICLEQAGEEQGAFQAFAKAVEVEPRHAAAFFKAVQRLNKARFFGKVVERLDAADDSIKQFPEWFAMRAGAAFEMGDYRSAQQSPIAHTDIFQKNPSVAALRLRAMVYDPGVDAFNLLKAAKDWDRWHGPKQVEAMPLRDPQPSRPLRIGFVNTRMSRHNIGLQQLALMQHRPPKEECLIYLYSSNDTDDEMTETIAALADVHCNIKPMTDKEAVERIREDKLDILVDYNEYANNGRLGIFAQRAAPIQVHYMGNALSTGLRAMDYRISDPISEPEGEADSLSAETIVRLPEGYHFYEPPQRIAELLFETPALQNGYVTFGGIHHLAKYNDQVLAVYKRILDALPQARFILARNSFEDPQTVDAFHDKLKQAELPMDRIELRPDCGAISTLAIWKDIDCVLDTFPFGSDATAMDSFFAGVPMVTLLGERIAGRRAAAILHLVGCPELVTESLDDYYRLAVSLGNDLSRLNTYREKLHATFEASPLRNHAETAAGIFEALRKVWQIEIEKRSA